jgi:cell division protein FtsB
MAERLEPGTPEPEATPVRRPRIRHRMHTPQEARQWRRRMAGYALIGVSFVLVVNAIVGESGYLATMRARRDAAALTEAIRKKREINQEMREEIRRLREEPAAVEDPARRDLRFGKPGERMIILKDADLAARPKAAPSK